MKTCDYPNMQTKTDFGNGVRFFMFNPITRYSEDDSVDGKDTRGIFHTDPASLYEISDQEKLKNCQIF